MKKILSYLYDILCSSFGIGIIIGVFALLGWLIDIIPDAFMTVFFYIFTAFIIFSITIEIFLESLDQKELIKKIGYFMFAIIIATWALTSIGFEWWCLFNLNC